MIAALTLATAYHLVGVTLARLVPSMPRGLVARAVVSQEFCA